MRLFGRKDPLRRLMDDQRGVSAVEFALIAPIMIFFYFGLAEFCQGYMAQKRMGHAAAMVGDLVSQSTTDVTSEQVDDMFAIGNLILKPFAADSLDLRITSVTRNVNDTITVDWSKGRGMSPLAEGATVTIPPDLIEDGESLVISEAIYEYDSPVDYLVPAGITFNQKHYLRPRAVQKVNCPDC
ncbi:TadE/TadG family type IV pilus assembly protein [Brevundimonas variabilis]|uniref:Flp pilus assembly protein TadG n=1 Tax=Brevundimonas variabilis TaxID=74312 RepID=A0A7W9CKH9_9CAUL|nr:TadE/TadG family type IV pilus assembly protein [Brevundimonas variabilis]MBB5747241.1 Flp pilus assembly protein TadG [Brevundimonas variabilis]